MSNTKRFYNKPNNIKDFYHPWHQFCCGNCTAHKDLMKSKRRRLAYQRITREAIDLEQWPLPDWREITSDPMGYALDMWLDYLDWLDPPYDECDYY
jgi:hypothetical protein